MEFRRNCLKFETYYLLAALIVINKHAQSEVARPRGVSLSRAALYNPERNFLCFDNSKSIPFSQVNDEYCDCPDASDEPGTSACPHGVFHCTNAGHKPLNLPSSRVNDGICDCCDGSDEYTKTNINCPNVCVQLGRFAREEAQRKSELVKAGKALKYGLSQRGIQLKQEKKDKIAVLEKNREEAEKVKAEKQALKEEIETLENIALDHYRRIEEEEKRKKNEAEQQKMREEAEQTFTRFDSNQDGTLHISELLTRQTFDKDKNGEVSEEEAKYFLDNKDYVDIEKFVTDCWPLVKPFLMVDAGMFKPPTTEGEAEDMESQHSENPEEQQEEPEEEEEEEEEFGQNVEDIEEAPEEAPIGPQYDEETQKLIDQATEARNTFGEAERAVKEIESELKGIQEYLEKDFGPDEEFAVLEGQCFDYSDHEYIYKLCPFDKATQLQRSGSGETRLGTWGKWDGPEENKYEAMLYERGQSCWNGPQRSTRVRLICGTEDKVTSVSEPNRCEYFFEFTTPAACADPASDIDEDLHDEL